MLFYRTDLFEEAGLQMPDRPTWEEISGFAEQVHDPDNGVYGMVLRGLPGWGANMAPFGTFINTFGGRWFNENWEPQLETPEVKEAATVYSDLVTNYGQPGATSDNFPECQNLFASGDGAIWYDATSTAGYLSDPETSEVADNLGFAYGPTGTTERGAHWLWSWALGIESSSRNQEAAFEFLKWATSKEYIELVGRELGWVRVPPGTRRSTYERHEVQGQPVGRDRDRVHRDRQPREAHAAARPLHRHPVRGDPRVPAARRRGRQEPGERARGRHERGRDDPAVPAAGAGGGPTGAVPEELATRGSGGLGEAREVRSGASKRQMYPVRRRPAGLRALAEIPPRPKRQRASLLYPGLFVVVIITQVPFLLTVYLSLQSWNIIRPDLGRRFVGLGNYAREVFSAEFGTIMLQTLAITALSLVLCCLVGLGLAMLLNREFFAKGLVQTLLVTPFFIMPTVTGLIWKNELFSPNFGLVTWFAGLVGIEGFNPMADYPLIMVSTMVAWQWEPLFMLVLLAGLAAIPEEEREAAQLDGCSRFEIFRYVELPHLLPYYRMVILLGSIFILQVFGEIYVGTAGGPGTSSMNLQYLTFQTGLVGWQVGAASAIGVATLVLTIIILTGLLRTMNAVVREEA